MEPLYCMETRKVVGRMTKERILEILKEVMEQHTYESVDFQKSIKDKWKAQGVKDYYSCVVHLIERVPEV